ncbi:hypothetical protein C9374_009815 [Naegleria lovaniensis]|uniref:Uncharacterized protein n=1 Tax=Naegleria lovaniensis TaxID=51637 RepID=A0AA88H292_NAELO|nr:uncharacterized protein C9374_009815 [Naegleria lovaniensis]KAG2393238.1 hypothetical protein C9374_009815 [Naegleria lovaniensis]
MSSSDLMLTVSSCNPPSDSSSSEPLISTRWRDLLLESANGSLFIHEIIPYLNVPFLLNTLYLVSKPIARLIQQQDHHTIVVNLSTSSSTTDHPPQPQQQINKTVFKSMIYFVKGLRVGYWPYPSSQKQQELNHNTRMNVAKMVLEHLACHSNRKEVVMIVDELHYYKDLSVVANTCKSLFLDIAQLVCSNILLMAQFSNLVIKHVKICNGTMKALTNALEQGLQIDRLTVGGVFLVQEMIDISQMFGKNTTVLVEKVVLTSEEAIQLLPIMDQLAFSSLEVLVDGGSSTELMSSFKVKTKSLTIRGPNNTNSKIFLPQVVSNTCEKLEFANIRDNYLAQSFTTLNLLPNLLYLKQLGLDNCKISIAQQENDNNNSERQFYMPNLNVLTLQSCTFSFEKTTDSDEVIWREDNSRFIHMLQIPNATDISLIKMNLKQVPTWSSENIPNLTSLNLEGNRINDHTFNVSYILQHTKLKHLVLRNNDIRLVTTLEPLFKKFQRLDIRDLSIKGKLMRVNGSIQSYSEDILKETERNKYYDSPSGCSFVLGSDADIYRRLKSLFSRDEFEKNPYIPEPHYYLIRYLKKSVLGPPQNIIFWNVLCSAQIDSSTNMDLVREITQFAVYKMREKKWCFFAKIYFTKSRSQLCNMASKDMESSIPYIITNWSYFASHLSFVRQLRDQYGVR